ncbi:outer membrane protein OmpA [Minicystis rosea]|nr:outer membrane protein OmpA [Minicystis rosea]
MRLRSRRARWSAALMAALGALAPASALAQGAIERFTPAPAGDAMFGVPSPAVGGHLVPRAAAIFDFAYKPLSIQDETGARHSIVSRQAFLHVAVSFALWDRLLLSVDMPFALLQAGDSPTVAGRTFASPSGPQVGDLRLGARARLYGDYWDAFQIGVGGYVWVPTAPQGSYAGDGAVRGQPQLLLGGRIPHFVWNVAVGTTLRGSEHPHTFDAGAGAALVLGDNSFFQIGPELTVSAPFTKDRSFSTPTAVITTASPAAAELLIGAKIRPIPVLVIGAGAGPGLSQGYGTPIAVAVASIGYEPLPPRADDRDADGIPDKEDACPDVKGVKNPDPKKNGCPPDRDGDGVPDLEDACPDVPGVASSDPKKNGCPPDRDGDGIPDDVDACPDQKGVASSDPKKNGCPPDRDGDGIPDEVDACPDVPGVASSDPKKNGCPADRDEDGIADAVDACPDQKGSSDPDPKKHGCPHVVVTKKEIVITRQVHFLFGKSQISQTVDPVSDGLLTEVRDAIQTHPEMKHIEVQGHADTVGGEEYNQSLSQARADAVRHWLIRRGIPATKLTAKGYGSKVPLATNDTPEGRAENRRVEFKIIE